MTNKPQPLFDLTKFKLAMARLIDERAALLVPSYERETLRINARALRRSAFQVIKE